jgi:hypothetical protein
MPVLEGFSDFLGFGRDVIVPKESVVVEDGDILCGESAELPSAGKGPIEKVPSCLFYYVRELMVHVRIEGVRSKGAAERQEIEKGLGD